MTIVLAVAGALFGAEYNIFEELSLPRIPIDEGSLTAGAAIALAAVVILTLLAATGGGKAGERYHRKIDRLGLQGLSHPLHQFAMERDVLAAVCPHLSEPGPERREVDRL